MKNINVTVDYLCHCKASMIRDAFARIGVSASANDQEGLISLSYDPARLYFVELLEMIEDQGCVVKKLV